MADREDPPPAPTARTGERLSADEADRLSEKFQPGWETPGAAAPRPEPRKPAKQTLMGIAPVAAKPPEQTKAPSRPPSQTLIGIAPVSSPPPSPISKPTGSSPVTAGGSPDGPSGIAKIYKPKDDPAAPPVVLTEELLQTEAATHAELEARRHAQSSRHVQTLMNVKAPELPVPAAGRRWSGLWQLLLGVAAGVVVVATVFKLSSTDGAHPEPAALIPNEPAVVPSAPAPAPRVADTASAPPEEAAVPAAALPVETTSGDTVEPAAEPEAAAPQRKSPKTRAPKKIVTQQPPSPKEPAPPPPAAKGGLIVRDSPF